MLRCYQFGTLRHHLCRFCAHDGAPIPLRFLPARTTTASIGAAGSASPQVGVGGREEDAVGTGQSYLRRSQMPPDGSVMSAWEEPWLCTLRYSAALLPASFGR